MKIHTVEYKLKMVNETMTVKQVMNQETLANLLQQPGVELIAVNRFTDAKRERKRPSKGSSKGSKVTH